MTAMSPAGRACNGEQGEWVRLAIRQVGSHRSATGEVRSRLASHTAPAGKAETDDGRAVRRSNSAHCEQNRGYKVALNLQSKIACCILTFTQRQKCRRGGTGRRDRLRIYYRKVWRFESSRRHHDVAGLGARGLAGRRLLCKEKIVGSNPTGSTSHTGAEPSQATA